MGAAERSDFRTDVEKHVSLLIPKIPGKSQGGLGSLRVREPEVSVASSVAETLGALKKDILAGRGIFQGRKGSLIHRNG